MRRTLTGGLNIILESEIASHGEATIYTIRGHSDLVFKKYHSPTKDREQKLKAMVASPPEDPTLHTLGHRSIAWPTDLVYRNNDFEGFVMPKIEGSASLATVAHPRDRLRLGWRWTWRHLLRVAQNLAGATAALHKAGYLIGDVNTTNVLVTDEALVTVIDCDSMQIRGANGEIYRCPVGTPDFTAPEITDHLRTKRFADFDRTEASDNFALTILIYQLLFEGTHPYAGQWQGRGDPPDRALRMRDGLFAHGGSHRVDSPAGAPPFDICSPELQRLFHVTFVDGASRSELRPTARAFQEALAVADQQLATCPANPNHVYANHRTRCPWCERVASLGVRDPFPKNWRHIGTQAPLPPQPGGLLDHPAVKLAIGFLQNPRLPKLRWIVVAALTFWLMSGVLSGGDSPEPTESAVKGQVPTAAAATPQRSQSTRAQPATPVTAPETAQKKVVQPISNAIVFTRRTAQRDFSIGIMETDGSSHRTMSSERPNSDAAVSPDGTKIAYSEFGHFGWRLFVANADGSDPVQVCANQAGRPCHSPTWAPDGEMLAFVCGRRLCLVKPDGTGERVLPLLDEARDPAFSPDGGSVALVGRSGLDEDLYVWNVTTEELVRLTSLDAGVGSPSWAPDGKTLVFALYEKGYGRSPANVYIVKSDGSELQALTSSTDAQNIQPAWSPDGKQIVFVSNRHHLAGDEEYPPYERLQVFIMDADGANVKQLSDVDALSPQWVGAPKK